ncbi:hypothetical protein [Gilliamella sp. Choc5-1]|jgi:hypothetical protein|uniref:hypothetical protein n=1 Tax=Gilliamella sp. Choc5-1 TaxID=3120238 RepID=UPI001147A187|nr:hypothetical protein [Gilliamella apicola]
MTSNILTIKCPQCGSIKHSSLGNEKYQCEGCGAVYFVDKNDVHVFHHQQSEPKKTIQSKNNTINIVVIVCASIFCTVIFGVIAVLQVLGSEGFFESKPVAYSAKSTSDKNRTNPPATVNKEKWTHKNIDIFVYKDTPYLIMKSKLKISKDDPFSRREEQHFIKIYDTQANQFVGQFELPIDEKSHFSEPIPYELRKWDNDDFLLLIDKQKLYRLNKHNKIFEYVNDTMFAKQPEFSQGLAEIKFVSKEWGDGLYVYTNKGKHFYFYPNIDKLYKDDEFYKARTGATPLPANFSVRTAFSFSTISNDYPDENCRLIQYEYQYLPGYPREEAWFKWSNFYYTKQNQAIVIINSDTPYEKVLLEPWLKKASRTLKYRDFTPDRVYFFPKLLDDNGDSLLIAFSTSPVKKDNYVIQLLDTKDADIRWSYNFPLTFNSVKAKILNDRIILMTADKLIQLNHDGKQDFILDTKSLDSNKE